MAKNYYFVATALPALQIGVPPDISFEEFNNLIKDNLSIEDIKKVETVRRLFDLYNIKALWTHSEHNGLGNYNEFELEEALITREGLPGYIYDYLDQYTSQEERIKNFPELISRYFEKEDRRDSKFLNQFLAFERDWRLVLAGFRAKTLNRDLAKELQFEDPDDDIVAQIMAQKDAKNFIPPDRYRELQTLFEEHASNPLEFYKTLNEYRFNKIDEMLEIDLFSIERILGYMVQLIIVQQWHALDKEKGTHVVNQVLQQI